MTCQEEEPTPDAAAMETAAAMEMRVQMVHLLLQQLAQQQIPLRAVHVVKRVKRELTEDNSVPADLKQEAIEVMMSSCAPKTKDLLKSLVAVTRTAFATLRFEGGLAETHTEVWALFVEKNYVPDPEEAIRQTMKLMPEGNSEHFRASAGTFSRPYAPSSVDAKTPSRTSLYRKQGPGLFTRCSIF